MDMWAAATNIVVWVGRTKLQIFTTNHDMTIDFIIAIICTILYTCKWYQSTGNIFLNIGVMSKNMDKIVENAEYLTLLWILKSIENSLRQVDSSHQKC